MALLGLLVDSAAGAHEKLHCLRLGLIYIVEGLGFRTIAKSSKHPSSWATKMP